MVLLVYVIFDKAFLSCVQAKQRFNEILWWNIFLLFISLHIFWPANKKQYKTLATVFSSCLKSSKHLQKFFFLSSYLSKARKSSYLSRARNKETWKYDIEITLFFHVKLLYGFPLNNGGWQKFYKKILTRKRLILENVWMEEKDQINWKEV